MSRYNDAARGPSQEPPVDDGGCHAYGCPMRGSISESTKGGGPWFCRFHFGALPDKWPEITAAVRQALNDREPELASEPA